MGCGASAPYTSVDEPEPEKPDPLIELIDSHGRQWAGPEAGIFFERDPAPAIIAHCAARGIQFCDPDFNPDGSFPDAVADASSPLAGRSAYVDDEKDSLGNIFYKHSVAQGTWLRYQDIPRDEGAALQVFDKLSVTDVNQGGVGNCWLCAVLCAAINYAPDVVTSAISPSEPNAAGCYSVRLWVEGRLLYIPIDDRIYCVDDGEPLDMRSDQKHEMYVTLIAKACCKWLLWYDLNGDERDGNRTIDEGVVLYCLRALTGSGDTTGKETRWQTSSPKRSLFRKAKAAPLDVVPRSDAANFVRAVFARGAAVTCGGAPQKNGLIDTHAYTVLWHGVVAGIELVQLRNPHGGGGGGRDWEEGEWQGTWSDNHKSWDDHPEVKAALEALCSQPPSGRWRNGALQPYWEQKFAHDGIFFMSLDDFLDNFSHLEHVDPPFGGVVQAERAKMEEAARGQPSSCWRIRPTSSGITRWDVSNLRFFGADGSEFMPSSAIESASAADEEYDHTPGWDAHSMLFGGDDFSREEGCWGGRCPDDDPLGPWVGGHFSPPVAVASVEFQQDDFDHVLLEQRVAANGAWVKARLLSKLEKVAAY
jgi:hypothetical protein